MGWIEVRNPADKAKLLFRFDPRRDIIEVVQRKSAPIIVDLSRYRQQQEMNQFSSSD